MRILYALDNSLPLQTGYVFRTLAILSHHQNRDWETNHLTMLKQNTEFNSYETIYNNSGNPIRTDHDPFAHRDGIRCLVEWRTLARALHAWPVLRRDQAFVDYRSGAICPCLWGHSVRLIVISRARSSNRVQRARALLSGECGAKPAIVSPAEIGSKSRPCRRASRCSPLIR